MLQTLTTQTYRFYLKVGRVTCRDVAVVSAPAVLGLVVTDTMSKLFKGQPTLSRVAALLMASNRSLDVLTSSLTSQTVRDQLSRMRLRFFKGLKHHFARSADTMNLKCAAQQICNTDNTCAPRQQARS